MGEAATFQWASYNRKQVLALAAFIVVMYTWVLLPRSMLSDSVLAAVAGEDGLIEMLGALSLLAAGGLFFLCFLRTRRRGFTTVMRMFLLALAASLVIGAGEELSWGQRLLGIDTPEPVKEHNGQQELNIHNLNALGPYGLWRLFEVFTLVFAVVLPFTAWCSTRARGFLSRYVPIVPLALAGLFLFAELMGVLAEMVFPGSWAAVYGLSSDVLGHGGGLGKGNGVTETSFSLLYAVMAFNLLSSAGRQRAAFREKEVEGGSARRFAQPPLTD